MPLYVYRCPETGATAELVRSVEERDLPVVLTLRRETAPQRVGLVVGATPELSMAETLRNAYHEVELREGSRFKSSFSKGKITNTLDNDRKP